MSSWEDDFALKELQACRCGCGAPAAAGMEFESLRFGLAERTAQSLRIKATRSDRLAEDCNQLLRAWERCREAYRRKVHGEPDPPSPFGDFSGRAGWLNQFDDFSRARPVGAPTKTWVDVWRDRAAQLGEDQPGGRCGPLRRLFSRGR